MYEIIYYYKFITINKDVRRQRFGLQTVEETTILHANLFYSKLITLEREYQLN